MASDKTAEAALPLTRLPALRPFRHVLDRISRGHLRVRIGDRVHEMHGAEPGPSGELRIHRPLDFARRIVTNGHVGLGEAYMAGDWDSPDVTALIHTLAVNEHAFQALEEGSWINRIVSLLRHRRRSNTKTGSRRNIAYHYDLGNAFYRLWLDPTMTYSAGVFEQESDSLEQSQRNKYEKLLAMLDAEPGQHLLEIGCGWGGLAREAATAGFEVTGITLSKEQLAWASETLADTPLADRIELRLQDYRDLTGQFDHIVSIEMFEAVGEAYWPTYMQTLRRCLRPGGRAALQVITIDESLFEVYKASPDFIQHYIFPGGMLPSVERFDKAVADAGLRIVERTFHAADYARTLALWRDAFDAREDDIRALGYDDRFLRMWRYYLSYCEAGFVDERINVMQVALAPVDATDDGLPGD
ncbi:MAG: cyclopropane-fatty-acyl-phospholipid synthase family protein [Thiohalocapsa sp.]|nr:cyclopropane-fatty-acyl-phospholipid synthase family protein [Thiohalocapsa sp.]MCF7991173.1 cyclopropane-fatty-acyl-phospholipid synthase family protein [Thiohalocapsa sp.]